MLQFIYGIIMILHGLVHMWYVTLARHWVPFKPDMGWTGNSWLLTNLIGDATTRTIATVIYTLITVAFVIGGIGVFANTEWWPTLVAGAAIISSVAILLFWDGNPSLMIQKGLLGLLINLAVLAGMWLFNWPGNRF